MMESNDKAKELVEKYADVLPSVFYNLEEAKNYARAKECALIAVDEKIIELKNLGLKYLIECWEEVKEEINKL